MMLENSIKQLNRVSLGPGLVLVLGLVLGLVPERPEQCLVTPFDKFLSNHENTELARFSKC